MFSDPPGVSASDEVFYGGSWAPQPDQIKKRGISNNQVARQRQRPYESARDDGGDNDEVLIECKVAKVKRAKDAKIRRFRLMVRCDWESFSFFL